MDCEGWNVNGKGMGGWGVDVMDCEAGRLLYLKVKDIFL
jgi:hypothetical protein